MKKIGICAAATFGLIIVVAALLVVWPRERAPLPDIDRSRLIDNVRVVDVAAGTVGQSVSVEIREGIITAIGPNLEGGNLPRIDGRGAFLVPGFWDMHVHSFQASPQMHFPLWIANGVTSVRDMMDCPKAEDSLIACAEDKRLWNAEIAEGRLAAPRIIETASFYLESPELTPVEAIARVRTYRARGVDAIKVYNRLSAEAYRAAAREAKVQGLRLVGHLPKAVSLESAIEAGQSSFEHAHVLPRHCFDRVGQWRAGKLDALPPIVLTEQVATRFDAVRCDGAIAALQRAGAWYVPTHVTREEDARASDPHFAQDPRLDYLDPLSRWAWNDDLKATQDHYPGKRGERALTAYFQHGLRLTARAHDGGVGILVGTDTAIGGFRYHDEMTHLVRAGLTTAEVLRAATLDAARYAGVDGSTGSVAVGKRADLVLLGANPLDDIANIRKIMAVIHDGRLYDRARLDDLLTFVRSQARAPQNWAKLLWGFARSSVSSEL